MRISQEKLRAILKREAMEGCVERISKDVERDSFLEAVLTVGTHLLSYPYVIDDDNRSTIVTLLDWLDARLGAKVLHPLDGSLKEMSLLKGFYLTGPTGTGKSLLMDIILKLAISLSYRYKLGGEERPFVWKNVRATDICSHFRRTGSLDCFVDAPILCIQDLGSEPEEVLYMGNRVAVLRQVIEDRADRRGWITHFTSNYRMNGERMMKLYGDRVASRFREMCNYIELKGKDRRVYGNC